MRRMITAATLLAGLLLPAAASAHVTLQPEEVPAGGFERLDLRVPNESEKANTTKVEVEMPDGFIFLSTEPVPGWSAEVKMEKLDQPVEAFGEEYTEQVGSVTFEADGPGLAPGEFQDFGLSVGLPDAPGETLAFPAIQTYSDGEVARWIGPEDAEEPAPTVELTDAEVEHGSDPAAASSDDDTESAEAGEDDEGSDTLAVVALIVGGLGLLAGGAALISARGSRRA